MDTGSEARDPPWERLFLLQGDIWAGLGWGLGGIPWQSWFGVRSAVVLGLNWVLVGQEEMSGSWQCRVPGRSVIPVILSWINSSPLFLKFL